MKQKQTKTELQPGQTRKSKKRGMGRFLRFGLGIGMPAAYYYFIYRPWHLRWGATDEEVARRMPGDELFFKPTLNSTRAVTINKPPEAIWPWLVQLGQGRGGWYSYEWIENMLGLDMHNATQILPEFQTLKPGDVIPAGRGLNIPVVEVQPNKALLLGGTEFATTSFGLYPIDAGHTRLIVRTQSNFPMNFTDLFWQVLMEPGMFIMLRKMLLTLKARAEGYTPVVTAASDGATTERLPVITPETARI